MPADATAASLPFAGGQELEVSSDLASLGKVVMTGLPQCHFTTRNFLLWICLNDLSGEEPVEDAQLLLPFRQLISDRPTLATPHAQAPC